MNFSEPGTWYLIVGAMVAIVVLLMVLSGQQRKRAQIKGQPPPDPPE